MNKIVITFALFLISSLSFAVDDYQVEWSDLPSGTQETIKQIAHKNKSNCIKLSLFNVLNGGKPESLKCILLTLDTFNDDLFKVSGIVGDYAIYEMNTSTNHLRFALKKEKGLSYVQNSKLGLGGIYKVVGTQRFKSLGGQVELYVLETIEKEIVKIGVTY